MVTGFDNFDSLLPPLSNGCKTKARRGQRNHLVDMSALQQRIPNASSSGVSPPAHRETHKWQVVDGYVMGTPQEHIRQ